jgi:CRP-like cAMP-binding protein
MDGSSSLRVISLFEDLDEGALVKVTRACDVRKYTRHSLIAAEGDHSTDVFFILAGTVRVNSVSRGGRQVIFSDLVVGDVFGEFAAVDHRPRSASLVALSDCLLARMPADRFFGILREHSSVAIHLIHALVAMIRRTSERMFELSALSARERIRRELVRLAQLSSPSGKIVTIHAAPTHHELAALIGSHREAVTKELGRLEDEGIIQVRRGQITVLDLPALSLEPRGKM